MQQLVDVCVNIPAKQINKVFTYSLPENFSKVDTGWRVVVPFAGNVTEGFIIKKYVGQYENDDLKDVVDVIEQDAWFDDKMLALARWLSEFYLCTLAEAMRLFVPGKKSLAKKIVYSLNTQLEFLGDCDYEEQFLSLLKTEKTVTKEKIKSKLGYFDEQILAKLVAAGAIIAEKQVKSKFAKQIISFVELSCNLEEYLQNNPKCPQMRKKALMLLAENGSMALEQLKTHGISRDTLVRMQNHGLVVFKKQHVVRNSYIAIVANKNNIFLNQEQQIAVEKINSCFIGKQAGIFLLHGVTGSGKTQVYLETAQKVYEAGKQILVLVPEIALTGQTIRRFKEYFADDVLVFHSRLSLNERMDVFEYIKTGEPCVLIGVRSAVFAPFAKLGLVIMDEEHEYSYKQEERPGYHTRDIAAKLSQLNDIPLILGSATPSIESYYKAKAGEYQLLELSQRPINSLLPDIELVDMKEELLKGNTNVISRQLFAELEKTLQYKEQAIILLNRRGYSTFVLCRDCGYVEKCEHCAVSLVYHQKDTLLRCHYCGYSRQVPDECPNCKSRRIKFFGSGTQKAEQYLNENIAELRIIRMDQDTTGSKMGHDDILTAFKQGKFDLLLGTQMVAKGHDMHNVTLVGVLAADSIINLPDFRATERTFALLTQAAGRAGRGDKRGHVILQAYETEHQVLNFVKNHDYKGFYEYEINERKELFYPPYSSLIKISVMAKDKVESIKKADEIADKLKGNKLPENMLLYVNGPFTGMIEKVKDIYKTIIIVKTDKPDFVKNILFEYGLTIRKDVAIDIEPLNVI